MVAVVEVGAGHTIGSRPCVGRGWAQRECNEEQSHYSESRLVEGGGAQAPSSNENGSQEEQRLQQPAQQSTIEIAPSE